MAHSPQTILLKDYTPPPFLVDTVHLDVNFLPGEALVTSRLALRRNPAAAPNGHGGELTPEDENGRHARSPSPPAPLPVCGRGECCEPLRGFDSNAALVLDGEELETLEVRLDGELLESGRYELTATRLSLGNLPDACELAIRTRIHPDKNTALSGLYRSADGYFTQCEAEGFRRITWFPDRPDVMARYTVTLHGDKTSLPLLLSNGNPVASGEEAEGRHWATWQDPFPKPSYLFALVAAKLDVLKDRTTTTSGREVQLAIYVSPGKLDQCGHAMAALKKAMQWDEDRFGLECDLDHYMIVAVGDFNMGAMENKGLNIFNTKYVLARSDVATDVDFENIDRVVAHEYFHNWTGNRITCRDWFQLSLKEGLTVFRDQEFGADLHNRAVARIREVRALRAAQFPEDAGPMAHPVRPSAVVAINNFYTATVYEKGAEVVRMIQTLIGRDAFRRGMDLYFARHDGEAVTCEAFVAAMADAANADLGQFLRWYEQAGTPRVKASGRYDPGAKRYVLKLTQEPGATSGDAKPWHIPVAVGLVGPDGTDLIDTRVLSLTESEQEFAFENIPVVPVPSLLRDFSAPVLLDFPYTDEELAHLLAHDSDPFNRWEAGQRLATRLILAATATLAAGGTPVWPESIARAAARVLEDADREPAFAAEALTLPSEGTLAEQLPEVNPDALHAARNGLAAFLADRLGPAFRACHQASALPGPYRFHARDAGLRALRNVCLRYLTETDSPEGRALALAQFQAADNMSDQFAALSALAQCTGPERAQALAAFHDRWQDEALVMDKWLQVQASCRLPATLAEVERLSEHPAFDAKNPNKVYSLWRAFGANHVRFHAADGAGYRFMAGRILLLDPVNPQVAARLARCFDRWKHFDVGRQTHARAALETLRVSQGLSPDVREIVERALG